MANAMRLLVFDLDGTLVDSKVDLANSVNHALTEFGLPPLPNETVYSYVGNGATMLIRSALGTGREAILPEVLDVFLGHYRRHLLDTTLPYPGVAESLRDRAGMSQYVAPVQPLQPKLSPPLRRNQNQDTDGDEVPGNHCFNVSRNPVGANLISYRGLNPAPSTPLPMSSH